MNRPASMRLALGVGALMVVILALTGCGGGSAREKAKARPLPEQELRELRPGEYRTGEFEPSASFTVARVGRTPKHSCPTLSRWARWSSRRR